MDTRRSARLLAGFATSLLIHALLAALLFSLATSSSDQSAPESFSSSAIVTVTRESVAKPQPAAAAQAEPPAPHAPALPNRVVAAQPRSAAPHPPVRHELAKFAPTAPPNPTPQPESSSAPNPLPTQAVIAVTPAPLEPAAPTSAPAQIVAATVKIPPTAAPVPKPTSAPTTAPTHAAAPSAAPKAVTTPKPQPSALFATAAPLASLVTPRPMASAGSPQQIQVRNPSPLATGRSAQPSPGPKPVGSPGPHGAAPVKSQAVPRPVQAMPATPRPGPASAASRAHPSLNQRLNNLIPTGSPPPAPVPREPNHYSFLNGLKPTPQPQPTPPPEVLAKTQYLYEENVGSQRWKQSFLGTAPEEGYVKMYVTSVKRLGPVSWCSGWVVRAPLAGSDKWIVEPDEHLICSGRLTPFTPPSAEPPKGY